MFLLFKVLFDTGGHGYTGTPQKSNMDTRQVSCLKGVTFFSNHNFGALFVSFRGCATKLVSLLKDRTLNKQTSDAFCKGKHMDSVEHVANICPQV